LKHVGVTKKQYNKLLFCVHLFVHYTYTVNIISRFSYHCLQTLG
jgi:hypothetical protein